jgi:DNA-binding HxlR family transcriptional regulator
MRPNESVSIGPLPAEVAPCCWRDLREWARQSTTEVLPKRLTNTQRSPPRSTLPLLICVSTPRLRKVTWRSSSSGSTYPEPVTDVLDLHRCRHTDQAFALLGKRWTGLIIDLLLQRPARFSELERAVPGLSKRMLAERLRELESLGLAVRQVDPGPPISSTYSLTPRGEGLRPALDALREWAAEPPVSRRRTKKSG